MTIYCWNSNAIYINLYLNFSIYRLIFITQRYLNLRFLHLSVSSYLKHVYIIYCIDDPKIIFIIIIISLLSFLIYSQQFRWTI